jgi:hypothetical protein
MRPSTHELLESIAVALERQVAPVVEDKWAASVLRSAVQLLGHLAVRTEGEARVLRDDNADARQLLEAIAPKLAVDRPDAAQLRVAVAQALQSEEVPLCDTADLASRNDSYQSAIELLIRNRDLVRELTRDSSTHEELRAYLKRRLAREHHMYFPSFTGPPF